MRIRQAKESVEIDRQIPNAAVCKFWNHRIRSNILKNVRGRNVTLYKIVKHQVTVNFVAPDSFWRISP